MTTLWLAPLPSRLLLERASIALGCAPKHIQILVNERRSGMLVVVLQAL